MSNIEQQKQKIASGEGFIAALDQSGGSTPKALRLYGVEEDQYASESEMFDLVHAMRARIVNSQAFNGDRVIGAILFEMTMDREFSGLEAATFLWQKKGVVPFLKVDKGLADENEGVQVMKPMPDLEALLERAVSKGIFGTKMRSVIKLANEKGIRDVVSQQFEIAGQILSHGLTPIIEPEVDIHSPEKEAAESLLRTAIIEQLDALEPDVQVMLKLTLPSENGFYQSLVDHPGVLKVVALSGGYSREVANQKTASNQGVIASFSRALTEGLSAQQTDAEFDQTLDASIDSIYSASVTP